MATFADVTAEINSLSVYMIFVRRHFVIDPQYDVLLHCLLTGCTRVSAETSSRMVLSVYFEEKCQNFVDVYN